MASESPYLGFIWVPGPVQPEWMKDFEQKYFHQSCGTDYTFRDPKTSFDAHQRLLAEGIEHSYDPYFRMSFGNSVGSKR